MTTENGGLTEEEVYALIVSGDISRSASLGVIRSYGNRKAMEALERARKSPPESTRSIDDAEFDLRFAACLELADRILQASTKSIENEAD